MKQLLWKEMRLTALPLTYLFMGFALLTLIPSYPVLCGVFFVTLGIYQTFQSAREANDIVYSTLLPVAKRDVVKVKYLFTVLIELGSFGLMALLTLLRMTALADLQVYRQNAMMNANPFCLGMALVIFGLFNVVFLGGFFRTAYRIGRPFIAHIILTFVVIGIAEATHHVPGLAAVNAFGFDHIALQLILLTGGAALYAAMTFLSFRRACRNFEMVEL